MSTKPSDSPSGIWGGMLSDSSSGIWGIWGGMLKRRAWKDSSTLSGRMSSKALNASAKIMRERALRKSWRCRFCFGMPCPCGCFDASSSSKRIRLPARSARPSRQNPSHTVETSKSILLLRSSCCNTCRCLWLSLCTGRSCCK